jgi:ribokinase
MAVLDFGSCNMDLVYRVPYIVAPGETLTCLGYNKFPGGKGVNQAIALARAGTDVYMAGCVGTDDTVLRPLLRQEGVNCEYLSVVAQPTGQAIIQVDDRGENAIVAFPGANFEVTKERIDEVLSHFAPGDLLILQNEISNLPYLVDCAWERGLKILLNPSPFNRVIGQLDLDKLYCLILNEVEAGQFYQTDENVFMERFFSEHPRVRVMLTLGSRGCVYMEGGRRFTQQAFRVDAVDTTAAGDTFTGFFVAGLCKEWPVKKTLRTASAAAALAVTRQGAAPSIPTMEEVLRRIDEMEEM